MTDIFLIALYILLTSAGHLLLKFGAIKNAQTIYHFEIIPAYYILISCGLFVWFLATLCWLKVLQEIPLYMAYSLTSINYILIPVFARLILKEPLMTQHWIGFTVIALGIWLILSVQWVQTNGKL